MDEIPFTREVILERVLGDEEVAGQIIDLILSDVPGFIAELKGHLQAQELTEASSSAHRLKGVAGNIGAVLLANYAAEIDQQCRSGSSEGCAEILTEIEREFEHIRSVLTVK